MNSAIYILLGCLCLLVYGCAQPNLPSPTTLSANWRLTDIAKTTDDGPRISQADYSNGDWLPATVPGTVLTSLVDDKIYPEPLYGENNRPDKIPDSLCRTSYWYRTQFTVPSDYAGRRVWLNFGGINYLADVWVNGHQVGDIKGAFSRGNFDVTDFVTPGETAAVAVLVHPPPHPGIHAEKTVKAGTGPNGGILAEDGATFLCSIGWDWIPVIRDRNIGIWQNASLSATGPVVIENPLVASDLPLPRTDSAELTIQATVRNVTIFPQAGAFSGSFDGGDISDFVLLAPGESRLLTYKLHVDHPRLWWPNGYGQPNMYSLHLRFHCGSETSDACDVPFGIRKITYTLPGSDNLAISVNGVPVICRGGDWGMDEAMKRLPPGRLEAQVRLHQLANCNMIRNWVGQSTSDEFYNCCDRHGIMVWDEFFQPNPSDGPNPLDTVMYLANVREKVLRYRNHPCIALWCGRNEGNPPPVINAGIEKIMRELEPMRLYHPNSRDGRGVRSGGPYCWRTPREYYVFSPLEAFKTEIGSVSIPTLEAVHAMMPQKDWETVNDDWAEHDLCRGAQYGRGRPTYPQVIAQRYGPISNLADFVRKSQLANYESFRAMFEGRMARLFKPCTGVITWMSNPAQPSFVWQLYSHDLEPNASLFAVRKACEPIHIQMNQNNFHVMVVNTTPENLVGLTADVRIYNLDGSFKHDGKTAVTASPSRATDLGAINWPDGLSPVHFVKLELRDADGRLLSENFYWRASPDNPDDFTPLNALPTVKLIASTSRHDEGSNCVLDVELSNPSPAIALMAHLQLRRGKSNERVLPVYYSDNYVSLLPGESRKIHIETALVDLQGQRPQIALDGWNVTTGDSADVVVNAEALPSHWPAGTFTVR